MVSEVGYTNIKGSLYIAVYLGIKRLGYYLNG